MATKYSFLMFLIFSIFSTPLLGQEEKMSTKEKMFLINQRIDDLRNQVFNYIYALHPYFQQSIGNDKTYNNLEHMAGSMHNFITLTTGHNLINTIRNESIRFWQKGYSQADLATHFTNLEWKDVLPDSIINAINQCFQVDPSMAEEAKRQQTVANLNKLLSYIMEKVKDIRKNDPHFQLLSNISKDRFKTLILEFEQYMSFLRMLSDIKQKLNNLNPNSEAEVDDLIDDILDINIANFDTDDWNQEMFKRSEQFIKQVKDMVNFY